MIYIIVLWNGYELTNDVRRVPIHWSWRSYPTAQQAFDAVVNDNVPIYFDIKPFEALPQASTDVSVNQNHK